VVDELMNWKSWKNIYAQIKSRMHPSIVGIQEGDQKTGSLRDNFCKPAKFEMWNYNWWFLVANPDL
jgi:hypothetical protein